MYVNDVHCLMQGHSTVDTANYFLMIAIHSEVQY